MTIRSLLLRAGVAATAWLIAACASVQPPSLPTDTRHPGLPPETPFDRSIGTDRLLCVRLQGEHGESWRFLVDSGAPTTIFDRALRPKLGPPTGVEAVQYAWSGASTLQVHNAPRMFLSNTLLLSGPHVWSDDLHHVWPGRGIQGILGLDCLRQYCVQFDFPNHVIRFLDPNRAVGPELGQPFPLYVAANGAFVVGDFLGAGQMLYQVDTGCSVDAVMRPPLFQKACQIQRPDWMRKFRSGEGLPVVEAGFPFGQFGGLTYPKLIVDSAEHSFLGLRFLARHVVTLNFPRHTMYLGGVTNG